MHHGHDLWRDKHASKILREGLTVEIENFAGWLTPFYWHHVFYVATLVTILTPFHMHHESHVATQHMFSFATWLPCRWLIYLKPLNYLPLTLSELSSLLSFSFHFHLLPFNLFFHFFSSEFIFSSPHFHIYLLQGILFNWHYLISCLLIWLLFYFLFKSQEFNQDSRNLFNLIKTQETSSRYFGYFIYIFF